jgi:hypothetical protein
MRPPGTGKALKLVRVDHGLLPTDCCISATLRGTRYERTGIEGETPNASLNAVVKWEWL